MTSIILVITSLWCFLNLGNTFLSVAFLLGVAMILSALGSICSYIGSYKELEKSSWILVDGIATGVLGLIVLANQLTVDPMIPIFFGIWIMYSGMLRVVASAHMMFMKQKGWEWCLGFGILAALIGVYAFFNNVTLDLGKVMLVGIIFLAQGINVMALAANMPSKYKIITDEELRHRKKLEAKEAANRSHTFKFHKDSSKEKAHKKSKKAMKSEEKEEFTEIKNQEAVYPEVTLHNEAPNLDMSSHQEVEYPNMTPLAEPDIDIAGKVNAVFKKNGEE